MRVAHAPVSSVSDDAKRMRIRRVNETEWEYEQRLAGT